jgi:hypothetical protein
VEWKLAIFAWQHRQVGFDHWRNTRAAQLAIFERPSDIEPFLLNDIADRLGDRVLEFAIIAKQGSDSADIVAKVQLLRLPRIL